MDAIEDAHLNDPQAGLHFLSSASRKRTIVHVTLSVHRMDKLRTRSGSDLSRAPSVLTASALDNDQA